MGAGRRCPWVITGFALRPPRCGNNRFSSYSQLIAHNKYAYFRDRSIDCKAQRLLSGPVLWAYKRASRDHTDLFDKKMREGAHYYQLSMGDGHRHNIRLSHQSMERFYYSFLLPDHAVKDVDKAIADRFEQVRRIIYIGGLNKADAAPQKRGAVYLICASFARSGRLKQQLAKGASFFSLTAKKIKRRIKKHCNFTKS